tara:strand:- start:574 stop:861 length:288 start_codon:yes stop_codon:yes gene_type:complete
MNRDPYITFIGAKAVAVAWIGSVLGPMMLLSTFGDFSHANTYIGAVLILIVILSIRDGFKAKKCGKTSDFIALAVVPMLIPIGCIIWFVFYALNQ